MNMTALTKIFLVLITGLTAFACTTVNSQEPNIETPPNKQFNDYWYAGEAELTRYQLEQSRYGEIHEGDAVLIFVTEDFRTDKQVKYEGGPRDNKVKSVLKLNSTKKFYTGIYPYSMMTSVFTSVDEVETYKVSTSVQEWCGHAYSQLNLRKNKYQGKLHSYFQGEADQEFALDAAMLEDEIWSQIRLNPKKLPTGKIALIPGTQYVRLKHRPFKVEQATASLSDSSDKTLMEYVVTYDNLPRVLKITFEKAFPYTIVGWEEQGQGGLTTRATRTHSIKSPYWGKNGVADAPLRKELGLE